MNEKKRFEVDELDNKGYMKESKVGNVLKVIAGIIGAFGVCTATVLAKKDRFNKDE